MKFSIKDFLSKCDQIRRFFVQWMLQPLIIKVKIMFQQICKLNLDWDSVLPDNLKQTFFHSATISKGKWTNYRFIFLMLIKINRNLKFSYTILAMQVCNYRKQYSFEMIT